MNGVTRINSGVNGGLNGVERLRGEGEGCCDDSGCLRKSRTWQGQQYEPELEEIARAVDRMELDGQKTTSVKVPHEGGVEGSPSRR